MKLPQIFFLLLFTLPVFGAHYFSLDSSPLALISALLSLCLLIVFLGLLLGRLRPGVLRTCLGLAYITVLALYFFGQFVSYYVQGSYFNQQFYFHLNLNTLTATWSVYWPLAALLLGWLATLWLSFLYFRDRQPTFSAPSTLLTFVLVMALALDPGLRQSAVASIYSTEPDPIASLTEVEWERLQLDRGVLDYGAAQVSSAGRNLVLIFMEGLEKIYTDESLFPGLTPNLSRFTNEGLHLDDVYQAAGTEWTMGGIVSTLCGTPLLHDLGLDGNMIMFTGFLDRARCLPDVLGEAGYRQTFMGGAALVFAGKGEFLRAHSFNRVLGRDLLAPRLEDPDYLGGWGLFDDSLFDLAGQEFERLADLGEPFNLTLLTVDTHHPTGEPSRSCRPYAGIDNSILDAVHCTDQLVGEFIARLQQHPAYQNTIVALVSDHLMMRNAAYPLLPDDYTRRLYFTVLNAQRVMPEQQQARPMDLSPTLLALMQVEHSVPFLAGRNLLEAPDRIIEDNDLVAERNAAIRYINSNYLTSTKGHKLHYSLTQSRLQDLDFSRDVRSPRLANGRLDFTSTDDDPFIILPELTIESLEDAYLYVTLEAEQGSTATLYYSSQEETGYSEANTIKHSTADGVNHLVFSLQKVARRSRLRIDTGVRRGRIRISRLEIRS